MDPKQISLGASPAPQIQETAHSNQKPLIIILVAIVALLVGGTGGYVLGNQSGKNNNQVVTRITPSPTTYQPVTTDTPTASPADRPSQTVGWRTYQSDKYGYTIDFPESWYNLPNYGAPDTDKYFSNQDVGGSPLEMESGGVWVTLRVQDESDYYTQLFNASQGVVSSGQMAITTKLADLTIDGNKVVKYISETAPGAETEYAYTINYATMRNNQVFVIKFLTFNKTDADKNMQTYDLMAKSFKFAN